MTACAPLAVSVKVSLKVADAQVASFRPTAGLPSTVQETDRSPLPASDALTVKVIVPLLLFVFVPVTCVTVIVGGVVSGSVSGVHGRASSMFGMWSPSASPNATFAAVSLMHETVPGIQSLFASGSTVNCTDADPLSPPESVTVSVSVYAPGASPFGRPPNVGMSPVLVVVPPGPVSDQCSAPPWKSPSCASVAVPRAGIVWYWSQCVFGFGSAIAATGGVFVTVSVGGLDGDTSKREKPLFSKNCIVPFALPASGTFGTANCAALPLTVGCSASATG